MATSKAACRPHPRFGVQVATAVPFVLQIPRSATLQVSPAMLQRICDENPELRLERTASGRLIVMAPAGSESGGQNLDLTGQLFVWCRQDGTGKGFDSSTGFTLPNGAIRNPDVAWIKLDRWEALAPEDREKFAPICPDFVVKLRSPSDSLKALRGKMME